MTDAEHIWVKDRTWRTPPSRPNCRCVAFVAAPHQIVCRAPAVAECKIDKRWWSFCATCMNKLGRRIQDDRVEVSVPKGSLAARPGYLGDGPSSDAVDALREALFLREEE